MPRDEAIPPPAIAKGGFAFVLVVAIPFFIRELLYLGRDWDSSVYYADFVMRISVLALIMAIPVLRLAALSRARANVTLRDGLALIFVAFIAALLGLNALEALIPNFYEISSGRFEWPPITDPLLMWAHLTFGLLLVGITEELVFRKLFHRLFESYLRSKILMVVVSAALFGLVHWPAGVSTVLFAFVGGVVLMTLYLSCGVLWPAIGVHFVWNFVSFSQLHGSAVRFL